MGAIKHGQPEAFSTRGLTQKALTEPGTQRQKLRGELVVSAHKELVEDVEAHQESRRRSRSVALSVDLREETQSNVSYVGCLGCLVISRLGCY